MATDLLQLMWTIFYEIKSIQNLKLATEKFRIIHLDREGLKIVEFFKGRGGLGSANFSLYGGVP